MTAITEGSLTFTFPEEWKVSKFDEWSFYREQFMKVADAKMHCSQCDSELICAHCGNNRVAGAKGVDIIAIDSNQCCWCVEIKDYRLSTRQRASELADVVALKVRDTLAALAVARMNANEIGEQDMAGHAMRSRSFRVILHLELPVESRLGQNQSLRTNLTQRLKQLVKAIDAHPRVVDKDHLNSFEWTVG